MTKGIWTGVFTTIVGVATVAITAQTTSSPQTNTSSGDRKITVTGCLTEAPASSAATTPPEATGTTGTAGTAGTAGTTGTTATAGTTGATGDAAASTQKFLLTNAAPSSADPSAPSSTAGATAPAAASPSAAQTYRLIANPASLSPHVGKKLELTGTIEEQGSATSTESAAGSNANLAALRVESGKVVAASCSQ